ncbi:hypothetical protein [Mycolicibacterium sphagni]|uniref:hypothetical protein n=1 Tax=Mycolicibacterium sphagni TaxID=1786 RepID=UPI0031F50666
MAAQPPRDELLGAVVAGGVLDGELGQQRLGQLVVGMNWDEAQSGHRAILPLSPKS